MALFKDENLKQALSKLIRIGEVSSVDYAKGTARVAFDDYDSIISYDLPVLQPNTFKNKDYRMPDIGEDVLCIFLPNGTAEGFIVGSFYAGEVTPPESSGDFRTVKFSDGTIIKYDRAKHELTAEIDKTKIVANRENVLVNVPNSVIVTAESDVTVNAKNKVTVSGSNNVEVNTKTAVINADTAYTLTSQSATINAANIALNGNVTVSGNVTAGNITGANIIYKEALIKG